MEEKKIIIPSLDLKKFYKICAFKDTTNMQVDLSEKTFKTYISFKNCIFENQIIAETYAIFMDKLREIIFKKIISKEELANLDNKPINPTTVRDILKLQGKEISNASSKSLLSLLIKLNILDQVNIIKNLSEKTEKERDKEILLNYILRSKSFLTVKNLKEKFDEHPRKHKINYYLLELWLEDSIQIYNIDVPKEICKKFGIENIPPEKVKDFKSIETFRLRETGELYARVIVQDYYNLYPIRGRD